MNDRVALIFFWDLMCFRSGCGRLARLNEIIFFHFQTLKSDCKPEVYIRMGEVQMWCQILIGQLLSSCTDKSAVSKFSFCHSPVGFRSHSSSLLSLSVPNRVYLRSLCAHSALTLRSLCAYSLLTPAHSLSLLLTPAHSCSLPLTPAHSRSLLHMLMHEYLWENDRSLRFILLKDHESHTVWNANK